MNEINCCITQNNIQPLVPVRRKCAILTDPYRSPLLFIPRYNPLSTPRMLTIPTARLMNSNIPVRKAQLLVLSWDSRTSTCNIVASNCPILNSWRLSLLITVFSYIIMLFEHSGTVRFMKIITITVIMISHFRLQCNYIIPIVSHFIIQIFI